MDVDETGYGGYPPRPPGTFPLVRDVFEADRLRPEARAVFDAVLENTTHPYIGITTDGELRRGLFGIADEGLDTAPILAAARDLLDALGPADRSAVMRPVEASEWRRWTNAYPVWAPHGLLLEDAAPPQRDAILRLVSACMSARGARETRDCMRLNAVLGEIVPYYPETLTEWMYRFSLFGAPSHDQPWGWQLAGHHLNLHCFILGRQMVLTPAFYGAEPRISDRDPYPGIRLFDAEIDRGRELMRSLDGSQLSVAVLYPSMLSGDLPPELKHPTEGRMRSVRGGDNMVLPYEGLCAADMSVRQRELLMAVIDAYLGRLPAPAAAARTQEIERHYEETYFAWVGPAEEDTAFYYKVHSPVVLIELDCHAGVFLANDEPEPFHVHTVVRTPNGNDYGRDLLRQHYAQVHSRASRQSGASCSTSASST
ncbi:MAG TPA: DUF3500 domain-containing protein [Trebonia sp.]|nr:DUF3500 domain-containing protein [Trebonia sp.]